MLSVSERKEEQSCFMLSVSEREEETIWVCARHMSDIREKKKGELGDLGVEGRKHTHALTTRGTHATAHMHKRKREQ